MKIVNKYQVTEVGSLKALEAKDFYEYDFLILYNEFVRNMNIVEKSKEDLLNDLFRYFQFHEEALQKYKHDINEMYIQFASVTTVTHYKELEEKKSKFRKEQEQRQTIQSEENNLRSQIEEEQQRLLKINQDYVKLVKQLQKTDSDVKRKEMERKLQEIENQKRLIQNRIESLYQTEKTKRGYVGEEETSMRHNLRGEFNASKPKPKPKPRDPWEFFNPPANLGVVPPPVEEPEEHIVIQRQPKRRQIQPRNQPVPELEESSPPIAQTTQTQTTVPYTSFQFIEKGKNRYIEPITIKKMEELAQVKKTVKNAVLLNPHRYKRKPYIVRSQKLNYVTNKMKDKMTDKLA